MRQDDQTTPTVCGHRGAPAFAPENTLVSFDAAIEAGATWLEFDVRPTADGALVIHHDPATDTGVHIATTASDALPSEIPTLADVLQRYPSIGLDVEIKTDDVGVDLGGYVELVLDCLDAAESASPIMVTSFDAPFLARLSEQRSTLATGLLFIDKTPEWALAEAAASGHQAVLPWIRLVTPRFVERAHAGGFQVATWTVNKPAQITKAVRAGVDMIIGDDPARIVEHLAGS